MYLKKRSFITTLVLLAALICMAFVAIPCETNTATALASSGNNLSEAVTSAFNENATFDDSSNTITVLSNMTLSNTLVIPDNTGAVTLNLNGHTVTGPQNKVAVQLGASVSLTVTRGTLQGGNETTSYSSTRVGAITGNGNVVVMSDATVKGGTAYQGGMVSTHGGYGSDGIHTTGTVVVYGTVIGGNGGNGYSGGNAATSGGYGGSGVVAKTVVNEGGTIRGGNGGNGYRGGNGGNGGNGVSAQCVRNTGTITAGSGGTANGGGANGTVGTSIVGGTHEDWMAWSDATKLPTDGGNYYLTVDVSLTSEWALNAINGTVTNLCLCGHTVTQTDSKSAVKLSKQTLNLYDCVGSGAITHATGKTGCGVYMDAGVENNYTVFNLYGGAIQGNRVGSSGGGVYMPNGFGGFTMYGGSITGNTANTSGGGVYLSNYGTLSFTMLGGVISGNTAGNTSNCYGGGVYQATGAHVTLSGGTITSNSARYGGGVYVSTCKWSNSDYRFTLSGGIKITGNTGYGGNVDNVFLKNNETFAIGNDGLSASAKIGIGSNYGPYAGEDPVRITNADTSQYIDCFVCDNDKAVLMVTDDDAIALCIPFITTQPTAELPTVAVNAPAQSYQWYTVTEQDNPGTIVVYVCGIDNNDGSYTTEFDDDYSSYALMLSFDDLKVGQTFTFTSTTNTIEYIVGLDLSTEGSGPYTVTAKVTSEDYVMLGINGTESATLSSFLFGKVYVAGAPIEGQTTATFTGCGTALCRVTWTGGTTLDSDAITVSHNTEGTVAHVDATCTETGVVGGTYCTRCNDGKAAAEAVISALGHDYATEFTINTAATCTADGSKSKHCSRCDSMTEVTAIAALGHNFTNYTSDGNATCTEDGTKTATCDRDGCNATDTVTDEDSKLGHDIVTDNAVAPTCTTTGLTAGSHCSRCDDATTAQTVVPALGHSFTNYTSDDNATCTEDGTKTAMCDRDDCNATDTITDENSKLGHDIVTDNAVAPTCTTTGLTEGSHCSRCDDATTAQTEVSALGHNSDGNVAPKDATCIETGVAGGTYCTRCDDGKAAAEAVIPALGHDEQSHEGQVATCTEAGWNAYVTCKREGCDYTTYSEIDALGHSFTNYTSDGNATCNADGTKTATCDRDGCNATDTITDENSKLGHAEESHEGQAATCTEAGWNAYVTCKRDGCDYTTYSAINALGHDYASEFTIDTPATCTESGSKSKHCSRCDSTTEVTAITALGHSFTDYKSDGNATCTEDGTKTATCDRDGCNATDTIADENSKLGHDYAAEFTTDTPATCTTVGSKSKHCSRCDSTTEVTAITALGHSFTDYKSDGNATCTEDGTKTATCDRDGCNATDTISDENSKLGHDMVTDNGVAPTCTTTGLTEGSHCSRCADATIAQTVVPALGHNSEGNIAHKDATCTETGVVGGTYCTRCDDGKAAAQAPIPALGHNYGEWTIVKAATVDEDGEEQRVCANDNTHIETRDIPKRVAQLIEPDKDGGETDEVVVSQENGFDHGIELVVTEIAQNDYPDYQAIADTVNGTIDFIYDITLKSDGVEIQPDGTLTIKLRIPDSLSGKSFKLFHLHQDVATDMEYTLDGKYAVVTCDELSEFIFVGEKQAQTPAVISDGLSSGAIAGITIGAIILFLLALYVVFYFTLYRKGVLKGKGYDTLYAPMNAIFKKKEQVVAVEISNVETNEPSDEPEQPNEVTEESSIEPEQQSVEIEQPSEVTKKKNGKKKK